MVENKCCSLYVNNMHLIVMLIPYIEKELENEIVTILETGVKDEIDTFINKVNLGKTKKKKLKNINWEKCLLSDEQIGEIHGKTVLIKGDYSFIKNVNKIISDDNRVINCFTLDEFEQNSREILENHGAILNTMGVKKISEMFQMNKLLNGKIN